MFGKYILNHDFITKLKNIKIKNQYWINNLSESEIKLLYSMTNFLSECVSTQIRRIYIINYLTNIQYCPVCGKEILRIDSINQKLTVFCSTDCKKSQIGKNIISSKQTETCIKKYGKDYYKKIKSNKTDIEKDDIKQKREETNIQRYGVKNPFELNTTKQKIKETNIQKFGVTSYTKTTEYKERVKNTNIQKYGVPNVSLK